MGKELFDLIESLIDAKIEVEFASREEDSEGYRNTPSEERKKVEEIRRKINRVLI